MELSKKPTGKRDLTDETWLPVRGSLGRTQQKTEGDTDPSCGGGLREEVKSEQDLKQLGLLVEIT